MFDFDDLSAPALSMSDVAPPPEDAGSETDPSWRCWSCDNDTFTWTGEGWKCARCRSSDYYNIVQSQKHETEHGVWTYVPRQSQASSPTSSPPPLLPDPSQATLLVDRASRVLNRPRHGPPVPPQEHEGREQAESEPLTDDPIIELEGMIGVVDPGEDEPNRTKQLKRRPTLLIQVQVLTLVLVHNNRNYSHKTIQHSSAGRWQAW